MYKKQGKLRNLVVQLTSAHTLILHNTLDMLFTSSSSFVSLAFMVATTAAASDLNFGRDASGLETRATSCSAGQFLSNYNCYACPAGL
jgi:hypothetical protein